MYMDISSFRPILDSSFDDVYSYLDPSIELSINFWVGACPNETIT